MSARTLKITIAALALGAAAPVLAETLAIDGQVTIKPANIETPQRGSSMAAVEARFGAPANKSGAVGDPPITKWFYADIKGDDCFAFIDPSRVGAHPDGDASSARE